MGLLRSDGSKRPILQLRHGESGEHKSATVRARLIVLNAWLMAAAAQQSDLIVVLPSFVGDPLVASGNLDPVLPGWNVVMAPVHIFYPSKWHLRPATRACIDYFMQEIKRVI